MVERKKNLLSPKRKRGEVVPSLTLRALLLVLLLLLGVSANLKAQPAKDEQGSEVQLPPPHQMDNGPPAVPAVPPPPPPLRLADAIRRSLANVETVQANVAVQTAAVARFEALRQFIPLVNLPQLAVGFRQLAGSGNVMIFPDVTDGTLLVGQPGLQQAALNRFNLLFPLNPAGQITALPIAEEGIRAKVLMEQLVRRSQVMLAIQHYFETKQILYGIRTTQLGLTFAEENLALTQRKLEQKQAHDVEVTEARVAHQKAFVLLSDLEKDRLISQRRLALVLHQSRLLVAQQPEPIPIALDHDYNFDLCDPDTVDLHCVPDFPATREQAIELAKRQRVEVRILVVGLRIAQLQRHRSILGLLGLGTLPTELGFKNAGAPNGGITLGAIFGSTYGLPVVDIDLWSNIRKARLDVVRSQLELEKSLLDVSEDAGNSWDRWQQTIKEWELREAALRLRHEELERQERLLEQKQSIWVEVLGARVNLLQADANRWTAWYNLQLARFDVLRSTEQLLDYIERAKIAKLTAWQQPPPSFWHRWLPWLARKQSTVTPNQR
jgi:outer membrane protein TolC